MASAKEESEALGPGESHVQFYLPNGKDFHCLNHTEHLYSKNYFSGVQLKKCKLASATDGGKALLTNGYPTLAREKEIWIPAVSIPFLVLELEKWAIEHAAELAKPRV